MNEQRSDGWFDDRMKIPTGSNFGKILTATGKKSDQRFKYMYQLAAETILEEREETYQSKEMEWGIKYEPEARDVYAMENEVEVEVPGFIKHPSGLYGCSVDGIINEGCLEIKCPLRTTHIETIDKGKVPIKHIPQVQGHILVCGKEWCDFFSYFPKLPYFQIRVYPDMDFQEKLHNELIRFVDDLKKLVDKLRR